MEWMEWSEMGVKEEPHVEVDPPMGSMAWHEKYTRLAMESVREMQAQMERARRESKEGRR